VVDNRDVDATRGVILERSQEMGAGIEETAREGRRGQMSYKMKAVCEHCESTLTFCVCDGCGREVIHGKEDGTWLSATISGNRPKDFCDYACLAEWATKKAKEGTDEE
jgi:hypothetical protein